MGRGLWCSITEYAEYMEDKMKENGGVFWKNTSYAMKYVSLERTVLFTL